MNRDTCEHFTPISLRCAECEIATLQSELAAARTQIALYLDDYEQLCALMLRRDKDLAAARAELARAREVLISAWTLDAYNMGYDLHGEARAKAMARYAREIAHKGEEVGDE